MAASLPEIGRHLGDELAQLHLCIHQAPERAQSIKGDPRTLDLQEAGAADRIQHPLGEHATGAVGQLDDQIGPGLGPMSSDHFDITSVERVSAVVNMRDRRFVSSVVVVRRAPARATSPRRSAAPPSPKAIACSTAKPMR
jgi:hypothetical protein